MPRTNDPWVWEGSEAGKRWGAHQAPSGRPVQPQTIYNPYYRADGQPTVDPTAARRPVPAGSVPDATGPEDVNVTTARQLLERSYSVAEPSQGELNHQARLRRIIVAGDADLRKRVQEDSDYEYRKVLDARYRSNDPLTAGEMGEALQDIQRKAYARIFPPPHQVRRQHEEDNDPAVKAANRIRDFSDHLGLPQDLVATVIDKDPKVQKENADLFRLFNAFKNGQGGGEMTPSTLSGGYQRSISRLDKEIAVAQRDPVLFNQSTQKPEPQPVDNLFTRKSTVDRFNEARDDYNILVDRRRELVEKQNKLFGIGEDQGPDPTPIPSPTGAVGTEDNPIILSLGADKYAVATRARDLARAEQRVVYVLDKQTDDVHRFQPTPE